jgi:serine/threonine protein phosphatase PrpC
LFRTLRSSIVCQPAPVNGRINEDSSYFEYDGDSILALVIDGASERIKAPRLNELTTQKNNIPLTSASYAANLMRSTISTNRELPVKELLLCANQKLRSNLESIYGGLTASHIAPLIPNYKEMLLNDPRLIRMLLPACVATVVKIDQKTNNLHFAHAGDTALFCFFQDGRVAIITHDRMRQHDTRALNIAKRIQNEADSRNFRDFISNHRVIEFNLLNAIYHNYEDEQGKTDKSMGVGIINGLPQLEDYIETGHFNLDKVSSVLICSDGFQWPSQLDETKETEQDRFQLMRQMIEENGIDKYLTLLREAERQDDNFDMYPRFKIHDDATAIYMEFE